MKAFYEQQGQRFPDENIVKFFFKEALQKQKGSVLELGCGNGNNLTLFRGFGWRTCGIDISEGALQEAKFNFQNDSSATWLMADLGQGLPKLASSYDAILLPNINYYIPRKSFEDIMQACGRLLPSGGHFFIRARTPQDHRFGKGKEVEPNGFLLSLKETGEEGLLNVFYEPEELQEIIAKSIGPLQGKRVLRTRCDNVQNGVVITNDDVTIWGRKP